MGVSSLVTFLPHDDLALVILVNTNAARETQTIFHKIIDTVLRLDGQMLRIPVVGNKFDCEPIVDQTLQQEAFHPRSVTPKLEGVYQAAGWGDPIILCESDSTSERCKRVWKDFDTVDSYTGRCPNPPGVNASQIVAEWPRIGLRHIRLLPTNASHIYELEATMLFPHGYGKDKTPFELSRGGAEVRFMIEDDQVLGLGLFGTVDGLRETERQKTGETIEQQADAWFAKGSP